MECMRSLQFLSRIVYVSIIQRIKPVMSEMRRELHEIVVTG